MKMSKRLIPLAIVFIMVFTLMVGCGQQETNTEPASTAAATAAPAEQTAAPAAEGITFPLKDKVEFTCWITGPRNMSSILPNGFDDHKVIQEIEKMTNVHINWEYGSAESAQDAFNLMISAGDYTEIIAQLTDRYAGGADKAVEDGVCLNLNDYIGTYAPNFSKLIASDPLVKKATITDGGNVTGLPRLLDAEDMMDYGPVIRQDWLDDLGLASPVTYDDYYTVLKAFKEKKGADQALWLQNTGVPWKNFLIDGFGVAGFASMMPNIDAPFYVDNGTVKFGMIENGFKDYLTMVNKWYTEGLISKDFIKNMMPFADDNIVTTGKSGIWYTDIYGIHSTVQKANDPNYKIAGIHDAVKKVGDKLHQKNSPYPIAGGSWSVTDKCKSPEVAIAWLDNLYSEQVGELSNWGMEGEGYNVADGKKVVSENITKNPNNLSMMDAKYLYTNQITPYIYNTARNQTLLTEEEKAAYKLWETDKDASGFYPLQATMTPEDAGNFNASINDIMTYGSEMIAKFHNWS